MERWTLTWKRTLFLICLVFSFFSLVRFLEPVHPRYDSGAYIIAARSLAQGLGLRHLAHPEHPSFTTYPPVIPVMLSPFDALEKKGFLGLKAGVILYFCLCLLVFAFGFGRYFGKRAPYALAVFATGSALAFAGRIQGEIPFLLLSMFALIYAERFFAKFSNKDLLAMLVSLFLLANARQAGIAWSAGVILALVFAPRSMEERQGKFKRVYIALAIFAFVILPWALILNSLQPGAINPAQSSILRADGWDPEQGRIGLFSLAILGRVKMNLFASATFAPESLFFNYGLSLHAWMKLVFYPLFALMGIGFVKRLIRNRSPLEGVTITYCGLIFLTPWLGGPRFFTVILPALLIYLHEGVGVAARAIFKKQGAAYAGAIFAVLAMGIFFANLTGVVTDDQVNPWSARNHPDYQLARFADPYLDENDIVLAHDHCAFFLLTGNHSLSFMAAEQKFHPVFQLETYLLRGGRVDWIAWDKDDRDPIERLAKEHNWQLLTTAENNRFMLQRILK